MVRKADEKSRRPAKPEQKTSSLQHMPARSNKGGAVRGQARAAQVKAMNKSKGPGPTKGSANAMRGRRYAVAQRKAGSGKNYVAPSSAAPKRAAPDLKNYAGDPLKFLGDFFTGGVFRK